MTDALPPITFNDLVEKLGDPNADLDHYMRYVLVTQPPGRMGPDLVPNPSLVIEAPQVEGGLGLKFLNATARGRRRKDYRARIKGGWTGHRIVSEGDSWFQYPVLANDDIIDHLLPDHAIFSLGGAGDTLVNIQSQREILSTLREEKASALLLSAGGNDLFDNGQMGKLIEGYFPGATGKQLVGDRFARFLDLMSARYLDVFRRVHGALPHVHILIHGYSPAFPRGASWIAEPLTAKGVPHDIQHDIVKEMLSKFNARLSALCALSEFSGKIAHINATRIGLHPNDWKDEIHLNSANTKKVAALFRAELKKRLGAAPETSVAPAPVPHMADLSAQALALLALDEDTLLHELDLRVSLLEMDPSVADAADLPLMVNQLPQTEAGFRVIRRATRRLAQRWEKELHDLLCGAGGDPDSLVEQAVLAGVNQSEKALTTAIAAWLSTGPLAVPAVLAATLSAWLAGRIIGRAQDTLCMVWTGDTLAQPVQPESGLDAMTAGDLRGKLGKQQGLTVDDQKQMLEQVERAVNTLAVEVPEVPVDAEDGARIVRNIQTTLAMLGAEDDAFPIADAQSGMTEALILIDGTRPAVYVRNGTIDWADNKLIAGDWVDKLKAREDQVHHLIAATGRVIRGKDRSPDQVYGSAWMVADNLAATAKHVIEPMCFFRDGQWFLKSRFYVDFAVEDGGVPDPARVFKVRRVSWASPDLIAGRVDPALMDVAILELGEPSGQTLPTPLPLATEADSNGILDANFLVNVGHPGRPRGRWISEGDDGNPDTIAKALLTALIGDQFGVKRLSPGRIETEPGLFPDDNKAHLFTHEATTLGGSSGSAIMTLSDPAGAIMGLHFAGQFRTTNRAHWVPEIAKSWQLTS